MRAIWVVLCVGLVASLTWVPVRSSLDPNVDLQGDDVRLAVLQAEEKLSHSVVDGSSETLFAAGTKFSSQSDPDRLFGVSDGTGGESRSDSASDAFADENLSRLDIQTQGAQEETALESESDAASLAASLPPPTSPPPPPPGVASNTTTAAAAEHSRDVVQSALEEQAAQKGQAARDVEHLVRQQAAASKLQTGSETDAVASKNAAARRAAAGAKLARKLGLGAQEEGEEEGEGGTEGSAKQGSGVEFRSKALGEVSKTLPSIPPPPPRALAADATLRARVDAAEDAEEVPEPQLFIDERPSGPLLIWDPNDTLPRDVLRARSPEVWLYSLLSANFGGPDILQHFLEHYSRLGVAPERMLFVVNWNPRAARGDDVGGAPLRETIRVLSAWGVDHRLWVGQYSAEQHLEYKLQTLSRVPVQDWVVLADADEFQVYGNWTLPDFVSQADAAGVNFVKGVLLDRVAAGGALTSPAPPWEATLWSQYGLSCDVGGALAGAARDKVALFKAYLRTGVGNHGMIDPGEASAYFGPSLPGERSPRYARCGSKDLYPLTPYARYWKFYRSVNMTGNAFLWTPREAQGSIPVHHFKWRRGVLDSVEDRLRHYRGDDLEPDECGGPAHSANAAAGASNATDASQAEVRARFEHWRESDKLLQALKKAGGVPVSEPALRCRPAVDPLRFSLPPAGRLARAAMTAEGRGGGGSLEDGRLGVRPAASSPPTKDDGLRGGGRKGGKAAAVEGKDAAAA